MQLALAPRPLFVAARRAVLPKLNGLLVAAVIAAAAWFRSEHNGAPAMLMALLLGIAFHFLSEEGACKPGIEFTARPVLRFGVALLGARIGVALVATLVKLIRVATLAPAVLVISILLRRYAGTPGPEGRRAPLLPVFVIGFLAFAALNSFGLVPAALSELLSGLSRWALLISIAAVGMKTALRRIPDVGGQAILLIVAETVFIALLVIGGVRFLGH